MSYSMMAAASEENPADSGGPGEGGPDPGTAPAPDGPAPDGPAPSNTDGWGHAEIRESPRLPARDPGREIREARR